MAAMLDIRVASALMRLRLVERALHSRGRWSMEYAGVKAPVTRFPRGDRVSLSAHFPPFCLLEDDAPVLSIFDDGDLVHTVALDAPLDETGCLVWLDLIMPEPVLV